MELAKNYDMKKSPFPAMAQVKYDGVPLVFTKRPEGIVAITRQNEVMVSVPHLCDYAANVLKDAPDWSCLVAECLVPGMPFKESSGIVRRHAPDSRIVGIIFDGWMKSPQEAYIKRMQFIAENVIRVHSQWVPGRGSTLVTVPSKLVLDHAEAMQHWEFLKRTYGHGIEGMMLHHTDKDFNPGKRCWGMARYKPQPTIDLEVVSYEVAVSEESGLPLGMVGRINVELRRRYPGGKVVSSVVGIGPGRMTHEERKHVWRASRDHPSGEGAGTIRYPQAGDVIIAEIKYMPDPTYDALRQPTFQQFRHDKEVPDVLEY